MITYEGIDRNFLFLVLEVRRQLETTSRLFADPSDRLVRSVISRDNYTDTLKALIEKKCISYFRHSATIDVASANLVTAINVSTINLERIADFCSNVAAQVRAITDESLLHRFSFRRGCAILLETLPQVGEALTTVDSAAALRVCAVEQKLDDYYNEDFSAIRDALRAGGDTDDLLHCLFTSHYLERMGDSLLNIGEAILFAATGVKLKLHEYLRLKDALESRRPESGMQDYAINFDWETRSGCLIAKVKEKEADEDGGELEAIFKRGSAEKLRTEKKNIERWHAILPDVAPAILEFRDGEQDAALLLQFIDGFTLRDLVLNGRRDMLDDAVDALEQTLRNLWTVTRKEKPVSADFMKQVEARTDDIFRLHPEFIDASYDVGSLAIASMEELLDKGRQTERRLVAPFSVLIHGDLNADNIIYSHQYHRAHLVDLYRSTQSDYVQDISILLVSNFRLPVFEGEIRETLNHVVMRVFRFARTFAAEFADNTFAARMALGVARGFLTSTRFEVDARFAKSMFDRALHLLDKVINQPLEHINEFEFNPEILVY